MSTHQPFFVILRPPSPMLFVEHFDNNLDPEEYMSVLLRGFSPDLQSSLSTTDSQVGVQISLDVFLMLRVIDQRQVGGFVNVVSIQPAGETDPQPLFTGVRFTGQPFEGLRHLVDILITALVKDVYLDGDFKTSQRRNRSLKELFKQRERRGLTLVRPPGAHLIALDVFEVFNLWEKLYYWIPIQASYGPFKLLFSSVGKSGRARGQSSPRYYFYLMPS